MKTIKLNSVDLSVLKNECSIIEIRLANSTNIVDEMGGPEYFNIRINVLQNAVVPINENENLSLLEQFTGASYAGIYESYIEWKSFEGSFSIYPIGDNLDWNLTFQGSSLEDEEGDFTLIDKDKIIEIINPKSLYKIANEVLQTCQ